MADKLYSRILGAIEAEPWKSPAEVAHDLGADRTVIYSTLSRAGVSFTAVKRSRIKALVLSEQARAVHASR